MAAAKHKFQRLVFNPSNQKKFIDFLDGLQKDDSRVAAQAIIEQLIYAKTPLHLKKSIDQSYLESGINGQIVVQHHENELELNELEASYEKQITIVMP